MKLSAFSTPSSSGRNSGQMKALPAYAASMCSHRPWECYWSKYFSCDTNMFIYFWRRFKYFPCSDLLLADGAQGLDVVEGAAGGGAEGGHAAEGQQTPGTVLRHGRRQHRASHRVRLVWTNQRGALGSRDQLSSNHSSPVSSSRILTPASSPARSTLECACRDP